MRTTLYNRALRALNHMLKTERGRGLHIETLPWRDGKGTWYASVIEVPERNRANSRGQITGRLHARREYTLRYDRSRNYWRFITHPKPKTRCIKHRRPSAVEPHEGMTASELERHLLTCTDLHCKLWQVHRYIEQLQESARYGYYSEYLTHKRYAVIRLTPDTRTLLFEIYVKTFGRLPVRQVPFEQLKINVIKRHAKPRLEGSWNVHRLYRINKETSL